MATVYKVEFEVVSHWINYPPIVVQKMIEEALNKDDTFKDKVEVEVKVTRKA